ncbi:hypothetical protein SELMODRAFT_404096 [Selaginella moellendorffii]|uniref:Uncharacterized protein n=1 Tax=Selaginella moellendorffii TaxID=88036 RepID=D8QU98_SELML|nr:hypothetical protein SELMODRAFT_404096 [Selaginella moellendorffii]
MEVHRQAETGMRTDPILCNVYVGNAHVREVPVKDIQVEPALLWLLKNASPEGQEITKLVRRQDTDTLSQLTALLLRTRHGQGRSCWIPLVQKATRPLNKLVKNINEEEPGTINVATQAALALALTYELHAIESIFELC